MRVVFFGTPQFAADVLRFLVDQNVDVVGVISKPDKPQGRSKQLIPTPVKLVAEEKKIPLYQPEKVSDPDFYPTLQALQADLFVVVAYGEILKSAILEMPLIDCINLHASLLPRYRGAAPIQQAIIHGEKESGITIMHMVRQMDAGDIILQVKTPITENMTYGELKKELLRAGSESLFQVIQQFIQGNNRRIPQDDPKATYAPKIEQKDCQVDWNKSSTEIHNLIRGVNPEPGAWCYLNLNGQNKRLKLYQSLDHPEVALSPKQLSYDATKKLLIGCGQGALELLEVQLEGKKRMSAKEFFKGLPLTAEII